MLNSGEASWAEFVDLFTQSITSWAPRCLEKARQRFRKSQFFLGKLYFHEPVSSGMCWRSRAGKHALSLIIHSRCVYIRIPVLVRVPPIACTLMCAHSLDAAFPLKWPWCSSGVIEGETNGLWRLGWSCRMQQIRNVNITDGKTEGKKAKSRWCLADEFSFFPQRTALKLQSAADSLNLFCHCQDFFFFVTVAFWQRQKKKPCWAESTSTMLTFCVLFSFFAMPLCHINVAQYVLKIQRRLPFLSIDFPQCNLRTARLLILSPVAGTDCAVPRLIECSDDDEDDAQQCRRAGWRWAWNAARCLGQVGLEIFSTASCSTRRFDRETQADLEHGMWACARVRGRRKDRIGVEHTSSPKARSQLWRIAKNLILLRLIDGRKGGKHSSLLCADTRAHTHAHTLSSPPCDLFWSAISVWTALILHHLWPLIFI